MTKKLTYITFSLLFLLLAANKKLYAQITYDNYLSKPYIVPQALLTVSDPDTASSGTGLFVNRTQYVSLVYTTQSMTDVSSYTAWSYELVVKVMNGADTTQYFLDTLSITRNDSLPVYNALNHYTLPWYSLYIRVASVCGKAGMDSTCTANPQSYPLIPDDINLEAAIIRTEIKGFASFQPTVGDTGIYSPDSIMTQCKERYEQQLSGIKDQYHALIQERLQDYLSSSGISASTMQAVDSTIKSKQKQYLNFIVDTLVHCDTLYFSACGVASIDNSVVDDIIQSTHDIFYDYFYYPYLNNLNIQSKKYYEDSLDYYAVTDMDSAMIRNSFLSVFSSRVEAISEGGAALFSLPSLLTCYAGAYEDTANHWGTKAPRMAQKLVEIRDSVTDAMGITDAFYLNYLGAHQYILQQTDNWLKDAISDLNQQTYILCGYSGEYYVGCEEYYQNLLNLNNDTLNVIKDSLRVSLGAEFGVPSGILSENPINVSTIINDVFAEYRLVWDSLHTSIAINCPSYYSEKELKDLYAGLAALDYELLFLPSQFFATRLSILEHIYDQTGNLPDSSRWVAITDSLVQYYQSEAYWYVNQNHTYIQGHFPLMDSCLAGYDSLYVSLYRQLIADFLYEIHGVLDTSILFGDGSLYAYEKAFTQYNADLQNNDDYIAATDRQNAINNSKNEYCAAADFIAYPKESCLSCLARYEDQVRKKIRERELYMGILDSVVQDFRGISYPGGWNSDNANILVLLDDLVDMYEYRLDTMAPNVLSHCITDTSVYHQFMDAIADYQQDDAYYFDLIFIPAYYHLVDSLKDSGYVNISFMMDLVKGLYTSYLTERLDAKYGSIVSQFTQNGLFDAGTMACLSDTMPPLAELRASYILADFDNDLNLFIDAASAGITTDTVGFRESVFYYSLFRTLIYINSQSIITGVYQEMDTVCSFKLKKAISDPGSRGENEYQPIGLPSAIEVAACESRFENAIETATQNFLNNLMRDLGLVFSTDSTDTLNVQYVFDNWVSLFLDGPNFLSTADSVWLTCTSNSAFIDAIMSSDGISQVADAAAFTPMVNNQGPYYIYGPDALFLDYGNGIPDFSNVPYFHEADSLYFISSTATRISLYQTFLVNFIEQYSVTDSCIIYGPDSTAMAAYTAAYGTMENYYGTRLNYIKSQFDSTVISSDSLDMKLRWTKATVYFELNRYLQNILQLETEASQCAEPEMFTVTKITLDAPTPKADIRTGLTRITGGDYLLDALPINEVLSTLSPTMSIGTETEGTCENIKYIEWAPIQGALEYDLEWVYIDNMVYWGDIPANTVANMKYLAFSLAEPTRVTVKENRFPFPGEYPAGKLYFRVRGVARIVDNTYQSFDQPQFMPWGYNWTGYNVLAANVNFNAENPFNDTYENNLNWQWQTTFAEEGKFKRVISYYDGINRPRQVVTHLSTDKLSIIGETLYDHEGRAAVQVLPYPETCYELSYRNETRSDINNGNSDGVFDKKDFELSYGTKQMSDEFGASRYYSYQNPFITGETPTMHIGTLPKADGFPYAQSSFMPDNTGRLLASGGVGATHALFAAENHATKYFYSNASETELTRLFGKNVGIASHYKKNAVLDANGQLSIAYVDQEGRTVATALAGLSPENVLPLESLLQEPFTQNLTGNNIYDPVNNQWTITYVHQNEIPDNEYAFTYDYGMDYLLRPSPTGMPQPCIICEFDVEITVTAPDGTLLAMTDLEINGDAVTGSLSTIVHHINNRDSYQLTDSCDVPHPEEISNKILFKVLMEDVATYTISKKLKWSREAALANIQALVQPDVNTYTASVQNHLTTIYTAAVDESQCDLLPNGHSATIDEDREDIAKAYTTECDAKLVEMINQIDKWQGDGDAPVANAGMYYSTTGSAFWTSVKGLVTQGLAAPTNPDYISPALIQSYIVDGNVDATVSNIWNDVANWTWELKEELAKAHPEYCWYKKCMQYAEGVPYDAEMAALNDLTEGIQYRKPQGSTTHTVAPPFPSNIGIAAPDPVTDPQIKVEMDHAGPNHNQDIWTVAQSVGSDFVQSPDAPFTQTQSMAKWQLFRSGYLNAKNDAFYTASGGCSLLNQPYAVFKKTTVAEDEDAMKTENATHMAYWENGSDHCLDVCAQNVDAWVAQLFSMCSTYPVFNNNVAGGGYEIPFNEDVTYIRLKLFEHCSLNCGISNPMGIINEAILSQAMESGSGPLYQAINRFNTVFGGQNRCETVTSDGSGHWHSTMALTEGQDTTICYTIPGFWMGGKSKVMNALNRLGEAFSYMTPMSPFPVINFDADNGFPQMNISTNSFYLYAGSDFDDPIPTSCCSLSNTSAKRQCLEDLGMSYKEYIPYFESEEACRGNEISFYDGYDFVIPPIKIRSLVPDINNIHLDNAGNLIVGATFFVSPLIVTNDGSCMGQLEYGAAYDEVSGYVKIETYASCGQRCALYPKGWETEVDIAEWNENCVQGLIDQATENAKEDFNAWLDTYVNQLWSGVNCTIPENMYMTYSKAEYHYTLYYYDQANNLVQTVPPKGVHPVANTYFDATGHWDGVHNPAHDMESRYKFNSLEVAIESETPDGGFTVYKPDNKGRPDESINAEQYKRSLAATATIGTSDYNKYVRISSRTLYDGLGRIVSVFEQKVVAPTSLVSGYYPQPGESGVTTTRSQMTNTLYDAPVIAQALPIGTGWRQQNLRARVSAVTYYDTEGSTLRHGTYYSYDIHGNVKSMVTDVPGLADFGQRYHKINYYYDLVSGKVNEVHYQPDDIDRFFYRYSYDADNRLITAESSRDYISWERDAKYFYYPHGPLKRVETGHRKVQGTDYFYTIHGWLKGVNSGALKDNYDIGMDGYTGNDTYPDRWIARDAFGYTLDYYNGDYTPVVTGLHHIPTMDGAFKTAILQEGLYNGNITRMSTALLKTDETRMDVLGNAYQYDQLNRIRQNRSFITNSLHSDNSWASVSGTTAYNGDYTYDANGNILSLKRYNASGTLTDNFTAYNYTSQGTPGTYERNNYIGPQNRLDHIDDAVTSLGMADQSSDNYEYDKIGNLIKDESEEIAEIQWTVYGKVKGVIRESASTKPDLGFHYNASGQRYLKVVVPKNPDGSRKGQLDWIFTYYQHDAQGNVIAVYDIANKDAACDYEMYLSQHVLYGSSRLGVSNYGTTVKLGTMNHSYQGYFKPAAMPCYEEYAGNTNDLIAGVATIGGNTQTPGGPLESIKATGVVKIPKLTLPILGVNLTWEEATIKPQKEPTVYIPGKKQYEFANHLRNVLVTVSDLPIGKDDDSDGNVDYYMPNVLTVSDYEPFGAPLENRTESESSSYRFGYNGVEKENDLYGEGDAYTFEYRIHDARIGRFLSVDPLAAKYPWNSTYAFAENKVIRFIELEGLEGTDPYARAWENLSNSAIDLMSFTDVNDATLVVTTVTRGVFGVEDGKPINVDGTQASNADLGFAAAGLFLPIVGGSTIKKALGKAAAEALPIANRLDDVAEAAQDARKIEDAGGGAYGRLANEYDDLGKNLTELNHSPTQSALRKAGFNISRYRGAAFRMLKADHRQLVSTLTDNLGKGFRATEERLLKEGKFVEAFDLTVGATRKQYGSKYDKVMKEARDYFINEVVPILEKQHKAGN